MSSGRLDLLDSVVSLHLASTRELADDVGRPRCSVRQDLHSLARLGLVERRRVSEHKVLWYPTQLGREIVRRAA